MDNWLLKYFHYLCEIRILREKQTKEGKSVAIVAFSALFVARVFHVSFTGNGQNTKREVCQSINDNYSSFNTYARATHAPTLVLGRMTNREPSPSSISNAQLRWLWGANFFPTLWEGTKPDRDELNAGRLDQGRILWRPNPVPSDRCFPTIFLVRDSVYGIRASV